MEMVPDIWHNVSAHCYHRSPNSPFSVKSKLAVASVRICIGWGQTAEADFHVCPKRILNSARAKLEWKEPKQISMFNQNGFSLRPERNLNDKSLAQVLVLACWLFKESACCIGWGQTAEADFHVCPKRILTSARAKLEWQESGSDFGRCLLII